MIGGEFWMVVIDISNKNVNIYLRVYRDVCNICCLDGKGIVINFFFVKWLVEKEVFIYRINLKYFDILFIDNWECK